VFSQHALVQVLRGGHARMVDDCCAHRLQPTAGHLPVSHNGPLEDTGPSRRKGGF
jgi:hypothetical protein